MKAEEFVAFQVQMGWSREEMSSRLGISEKAIESYASGKRRIPKSVALACAALEAGSAKDEGMPGRMRKKTEALKEREANRQEAERIFSEFGHVETREKFASAVIGYRIREAMTEIKRMAETGFALGIRVRFGRPEILSLSYPDAWLKEYEENCIYMADPTILWGLSHTGWKRWSEITLPDPFRVFERGKSHGLCFGVTVSYGNISSRTIGSIARSDREFTDEEARIFEASLKIIHDAVGSRRKLSRLEIEVLEMVAAGASVEKIAKEKNLPEPAIVAMLKFIQMVLGASSIAQAVHIATVKHMIPPMNFRDTAFIPDSD